MRDDLDTAVEGLFRAFRDAPLDDNVGYCDHCVGPEQVEALRVTPLRQLGADQLGPLLGNAVTTWGDLAYFKHFLPRLLELVASGAMEHWGYPTFLPGNLARCRDGGTEEERDAIDRFLRAWWSATISRADSPCSPRDVLEVIDDCELRVMPFLDVWSTASGEAPVRHLAAFVEDWMLGSGGSDRFRDDVDRWLRGAASSALFSQVSGSPMAREVTEAAELLALYHTLPSAGRSSFPA